MSQEDVEQEFVNALILQISRWSLANGLSPSAHLELLKHIEEEVHDDAANYKATL